MIRLPIIAFLLFFCSLSAISALAQDSVVKKILKRSVVTLLIVLMILHFRITGYDAYYIPVVIGELSTGFCATSEYTPLLCLASILLMFRYALHGDFFMKNCHFIVLMIGGFYSLGFASSYFGLEICILSSFIGILGIILSEIRNVKICMRFIVLFTIFYMLVFQFTGFTTVENLSIAIIGLYMILLPTVSKISSIDAKGDQFVLSFVSNFSAIFLTSLVVKYVSIYKIESYSIFKISGIFLIISSFWHIIKCSSFNRFLFYIPSLVFGLFLLKLGSGNVKFLYLFTISQLFLYCIAILQLKKNIKIKYIDLNKLYIYICFATSMNLLIISNVIDIFDVLLTLVVMFIVICICIKSIKLINLHNYASLSVSEEGGNLESIITKNSFFIVLLQSCFIPFTVVCLNIYYNRFHMDVFLLYLLTSLYLLLCINFVCKRYLQYKHRSAFVESAGIVEFVSENAIAVIVNVYSSFILYIGDIFVNIGESMKKNRKIMRYVIDDFKRSGLRKYSRNETMMSVVAFLGIVLIIKIFM